MLIYEKKISNLPSNMWFLINLKSTKVILPKVKVQGNTRNRSDPSNQISIELSDPPRRLINKKGELSDKEWDKIFNFLIRNYDIISQYWNKEIDNEYLLNNLK